MARFLQRDCVLLRRGVVHKEDNHKKTRCNILLIVVKILNKIGKNYDVDVKRVKTRLIDIG